MKTEQDIRRAFEHCDALAAQAKQENDDESYEFLSTAAMALGWVVGVVGFDAPFERYLVETRPAHIVILAERARTRLREARERATNLLLLVWPDEHTCPPDLVALNGYQIKEICEWAGLVHAEAGDNDCHAGGAPECLRRLLPEDHYYQTWRVPSP